MVALYFGFCTAVIGSGRVTLHRHTRRSIDHAAPVFGFARLKSLDAQRDLTALH